MYALSLHSNNGESAFPAPRMTPNDSLGRLHKSGVLTDRDLIAAWDIEIACRDLGAGILSETRLARHGAAAQRFTQWIGSLSAMNVPAGPALDVVLLSCSLIEIDRRWRRRKGWARKMVRLALAEYPDVFLTAPAIAPRPMAPAFLPASLSHHAEMREVA